MKITESSYKDIFALEIEGEKYTARVLPSEGAKLASYFDKGRRKEYLVQNPSEKYIPLGRAGEFERCECSGFDDMFPTIDPTVVDGREYPDHGEVARVSFSYEIRSDSLLLTYFSEQLGYSYEKTLFEDDDGKLCINYRIENRNSSPLKALFAGHCLVRIEQGGRVIAPFSEGDAIDLVYDTEREPASMPYKPDMLSTVWGDRPYAKKYYFSGKCRDGSVAYEYPSGDRFVLEFDKEKLEYLGIWMDFGKINGTYSVGLEPCSLGYDTVQEAKRHGQEKDIEKTLEFRLKISVI